MIITSVYILITFHCRLSQQSKRKLSTIILQLTVYIFSMNLIKAFALVFLSLVDPVTNDKVTNIQTRRKAWAEEFEALS